jgi:hypothetical protein
MICDESDQFLIGFAVNGRRFDSRQPGAVLHLLQQRKSCIRFDLNLDCFHRLSLRTTEHHFAKKKARSEFVPARKKGCAAVLNAEFTNDFAPIRRRSAQVDSDGSPRQLATMNTNILSRLSSAHLRRAAAIQEQIEQKEKELTSILGIPEVMTVGGMARRHRAISAATRAKLSAAAKSRWAKMKGRRS